MSKTTIKMHLHGGWYTLDPEEPAYLYYCNHLSMWKKARGVLARLDAEERNTVIEGLVLDAMLTAPLLSYGRSAIELSARANSAHAKLWGALRRYGFYYLVPTPKRTNTAQPREGDLAYWVRQCQILMAPTLNETVKHLLVPDELVDVVKPYWSRLTTERPRFTRFVEHVLTTRNGQRWTHKLNARKRMGGM